MNFVEECGNLFDLDNDWCLAHCVGNDFVMGKGIAVLFKEKYGNVEYLKQNSNGIGTALLLDNKKIDRNVFYLITKKWSKFSKPTYFDLENSIKNMFQQCKENNIKKIGMPKIGCGLDGLKWEIVKQIIISNKPDDIKICIKSIN